jgi:hypothetical protein
MWGSAERFERSVVWLLSSVAILLVVIVVLLLLNCSGDAGVDVLRELTNA